MLGFRSWIPVPVVALVLVLALAPPASAAPTDGAAAQVAALMAEKKARTPAEHKISSSLLLEHKRRQGDPALQLLTHLRPLDGIDGDGRVTVDVDAQITPLLEARVTELGGRVLSAFPRFRAARLHMPLDRLPALAEMPEVTGIRPADRFMTQVTTEGDEAHRADVARTTFGVDGTGVAVGAMSDSVDALGDLQTAGELPPGVTVLTGQSGNPGSSEGTALLEIVHDMAPGAELFFATGSGGQAQMAQNILDLQAAGCDVIVDDVLYFAEPVFQDGVIAQAVDTVVAEGVAYFSSAGNSGNLDSGTSGVFEGDYTGAPLPAVLTGAGLSAHDFGGGDVTTTLTLDTPFFITLQWSDPQDGATNDYDLYLLDPAGANVIQASTNTQDGTQDPFEFLDSTVDDHTDHQVVVVKFAGDDRFLHLNSHRGELDHGTDGQIFGHPSALGAMAIAAVRVPVGGGPFTGGPANPVEAFSSDGPRRIFFEPDGTPVEGFVGRGGQTSVVRQKPDVTAANGVSTATPGFETFFGTSASAPHAAAVSALLSQLHLGLGPAGIYEALKSTTRDIDAPGFDRNSGNGIFDAPDAMNAPIFADGFESGSVSAWTSSEP